MAVSQVATSESLIRRLFVTCDVFARYFFVGTGSTPVQTLAAPDRANRESHDSQNRGPGIARNSAARSKKLGGIAAP